MYRVIVKKTGSLQPNGTFWQRTYLYCGEDRAEAARIYWESECEDFGGSFGNPMRETTVERADLTDDIEDMEWEGYAYPC
jgi:hypothetical protein